MHIIVKILSANYILKGNSSKFAIIDNLHYAVLILHYITDIYIYAMTLFKSGY